MSFDLAKIFIDWRRIVPNGVPNPKNDYHLVLLKEICLKRGIDEDVVNNVMLTLEKDGEDDKYVSIGYGKYKLKKMMLVIMLKPEKMTKRKILMMGKRMRLINPQS